MNMVPYDYRRFIDALTKAVEAGDVPLARIDDAVRRILTVKFELGLFEQPFANRDLLAEVGSDEHRATAREAVARSLVLLKNDDGILPLSKDVPALFVAGAAADDIGIQSGGWTIEWQGKEGAITPGTTILQGIQATVAGSAQVEYSPAGNFSGDPAAANAVCLAIVGERPYAEGKGDSSTLGLPTGENRVLRRLEQACAKLVVIIVSGRPVMVTDYVDQWDALVAAWLPGTEGQGVADVLFGDVAFSGKLPVTWPASIDQLPVGSSAEAPLFPFGFGLTP
jgi:beta-glucosidase